MKTERREAGGQAVCTRVMWNDNGHGVIVGRNMDWLEDMGTNLWVLPRGAKRAGMDRDPNPLRWTARYGSVIASVHDYASADGINERGLAAQMLWLAESDYGPRETLLPGLSLTLWTQLFLDQFSTVADCTAFRPGTGSRSGRSRRLTPARRPPSISRWTTRPGTRPSSSTSAACRGCTTGGATR